MQHFLSRNLVAQTYNNDRRPVGPGVKLHAKAFEAPKGGGTVNPRFNRTVSRRIQQMLTKSLDATAPPG
jgi:hypothetical protein